MPGASGSAKVQAPPPGLAGVRGRVLADGELRGFAARGPRLAGFSAASWVVVDRVSSSQRASASAALRRLGFVTGVREDLAGPDGVAGLSTVEQFHSPAAARRELAQVSRDLVGPGVVRFAVVGVPDAHGFAAAGAGINVAFAAGSYCYLIGAQAAPPGAAGGATRATMIAAVQSLYHRVHG